jgi:hypothetical protein
MLSNHNGWSNLRIFGWESGLPTRTSDLYIDLTFFLYYVILYYITAYLLLYHIIQYMETKARQRRETRLIYTSGNRDMQFSVSSFQTFHRSFHMCKYLRFADIFSHVKLKMWKLISMWKWNSLHMKRHFHNVKFS